MVLGGAPVLYIVNRQVPRLPEEMSESMDKASSLTPELPGRSLRHSSPEIITLEGVPLEPRSLAPPGTVTCLVATHGSSLLSQIRSAAYRKDYEELHRHADTIATERAGASRRPKRPDESLSNIAVLTEFRYGDRILVQGMFPSETLHIATASVPYAGGPLRDDAFQAVDYFHPAIALDTEHVVVVSAPSLTELERAILGRVPEEHSEASASMPRMFWPSGAAYEAWDRPEQEEAERTFDEKAFEEVDASATQHAVAQVDETASARTLLTIRMQFRTRR